jgi:hypothetical protein
MQLWHLVVLSFLAELLEMGWQYAPTLRQVLEKVYGLYRRSVFLLLLGHSGYLYLIWLSLRYDLLNWPIVVAIALKTLDIFTKIEMVRKLYIRQEKDQVLGEMLGMEVPFWLWLIGPLTYPWLVWLAFSPA